MSKCQESNEAENDFKVVDRRKSSGRKKSAAKTDAAPQEKETPEETPPAEPEQETTPEEPQQEEPGPEEAGPEEPSEQLPLLDAYSSLRWCIGLLSAQAWQWLGLTADPASGAVNKDLDQAQLCIDSVAALVEKLAPKVEPAERRELETLVSNLRLNFVNQSQTPGASPGAGE